MSAMYIYKDKKKTHKQRNKRIYTRTKNAHNKHRLKRANPAAGKCASQEASDDCGERKNNRKKRQENKEEKRQENKEEKAGKKKKNKKRRIKKAGK